MFMMVTEIDDIEFLEIRREEQQQELISILNKLIVVVEESKPETLDLVPLVSKMLDGNKQSIELVLSRIKELAKPQPVPQITVETNQDKVIKALSELAANITRNLSEIKSILATESKPVPKTTWVFTINRGRDGLLQSVVATPKP